MKKINIINLMYNLYIFIFIFTMINREFLFFGVDLRYILLLLGFILICLKWININKYRKTIKKDKNFKNLAIFFLWCLVCNISWFWNGLDLDIQKFINQVILIINNFMSLIVIYLYKEYIKPEKIYRIIIFSCVILLISFILISMGYKLCEISGSDVRASVVSTTDMTIEHKNLFGGNFRLAGYAEDANYASMFWVIGILSVLKIKSKKIFKLIFIIAFSICLGFSCSKTILLACIIGIIFVFLIRLLKFNVNTMKLINTFLVIGIVLICIIIPKINSLYEYMPMTLTSRFNMWNLADKLFSKSPIIGNGIDSYKSYINEYYNGTRYTQCHNTYWQVLSELGIIGIVLFATALIKILNENNKKLNYFLLFVYIIYAMTYETIALQFTIAILYLLPMLSKEE